MTGDPMMRGWSDERVRAEVREAEGRGRMQAIEVLELMRQHERVASHVALLICATESIRALTPDSAKVTR